MRVPFTTVIAWILIGQIICQTDVIIMINYLIMTYLFSDVFPLDQSCESIAPLALSSDAKKVVIRFGRESRVNTFHRLVIFDVLLAC